jgi:hypothetical protein
MRNDRLILSALKAAQSALNQIPNTHLSAGRFERSYDVASLVDRAVYEAFAPRFVRIGYGTATPTMCGDYMTMCSEGDGPSVVCLMDTRAEAQADLDESNALCVEEGMDLNDEFVVFVGIDAAGKVHELDEMTGEPTGNTFEVP